jgi:hypothetical protein
MARSIDVEAVERGDEYVHVRFRDPDEFQTIRTPEWAQWVAQSVSEGAEVRTGKEPDSEEWTVQSVLFEQHVGEEQALEQARTIVEKIDS